MIEQDTIRLLRQCDAGVKMGISAIDDVVDGVSGDGLKRRLIECRSRHEDLQDEIDSLLVTYQDEGKDPSLMTQGMAWMKTNVKMMANPSDETVADLMTDGCHMGVKSLQRYLNQYTAADEQSKNIAKRLIHLESSLAMEIRPYL